MAYSKTSRIADQAVLLPAGTDPLFDAWQHLREARQLPFDANRAGEWALGFRRSLNAARRMFARHMAAVEDPESAFRTLCGSNPAAAQVVRRQFQEHAPLQERLEALVRDVALAPEPDLLAMVRLSERAIELEIEVARHQNQLKRVLEEWLPRGSGSEVP